MIRSYNVPTRSFSRFWIVAFCLLGTVFGPIAGADTWVEFSLEERLAKLESGDLGPAQASDSSLLAALQELKALQRQGRTLAAKVRRTEKAAPISLHGSDLCRDAPLIAAGTYVGTTLGATADGHDECSVTDGSPDVWYRFETTDDETLLRLATEDFKPVVSIHFECPLTPSSFSHCASDDGQGVVRLSDHFYGSVWVRIAGSLAQAGDYELQIGRAGSIEGRVTSAETGESLEGFEVHSRDLSGNLQNFSETTDSNGFYRLDRHFDGIRQVSVRGGEYLNEIFEDVICLDGDDVCESSGTPVEVSLNTVQVVDFELGRGGRITGRVIAADTLLPLQTEIRAENAFFYTQASADTAADGTYTLSGLPPGNYSVVSSGFNEYVRQLWDGFNCPYSCSLSDGQPVTVTNGQTVSNIDFALQRWARISGTVRDADTGAPLANEKVHARSSSGSLERSVDTDENGYFQISRLRPGSYLVSAGSNNNYLRELYPELLCGPRECDWELGSLLSLDFDSDIGGVDFTLETGGSVAGRLTLATTGQSLSGVDVWAQRTDLLARNRTETDAEGRYEIRGLHSGNYWLYSSSSFSFGQGVDVVYPDLVCSEGQCPIELGTPVPVALGQQTPGIDFALRGFSQLTGRVTESGTGRPLADIRIELGDADGFFFDSTNTDSNGTYRFEQLHPDSYVLKASSLDHLNELYANVPCPFTNRECPPGTLIDVGLESEVAGINMHLERGGYIQGRISDRDGEPIFGNVGIEILDADGQSVAGANTDFSDRPWTTGALPPGTYYVRTRSFTEYENMVWNGRLCPLPWQDCPTVGDPVEIIGTETVTGIDFPLPKRSRITGQVTDAETGDPVSGNVTLWSADREPVASASLQYDGRFELIYLRPGHYYLTTQANDGHIDRVLGGGICFGPECDPTTGTDLVIDYDQEIHDLAIALEIGGQILGTIRANTGDPIYGRTIRLFDTLGRPVAEAQSREDGIWTAKGLPAGTYYAQALSSGTTEYHQIWGAGPCFYSCDPTLGTGIVLEEKGLVVGIDMAFGQRFGSLEGQVLQAGSLEPVPGIRVRKWTDSGPLSTAVTDLDGRYVFPRLSDEPLRISTQAAPAWRDQVWPEVACPIAGCEQVIDQGEAVVVPADTELAGFDFILEADDPCTDPKTLCLGDERFLIRARWKTDTQQGLGKAAPLTEDSGYFHFFSPTNVEVLVKVLDGCGINGFHWFFAAGLTNLEVELTVQDLVSGEERRYTNPAGQTFVPIQDLDAFSNCSTPDPVEAPPTDGAEITSSSHLSPNLTDLGKTVTCTADPTTACLTGDRFRVEMNRDTGIEDPQPALPEPLTSDTAYFWFFDPDNVETLVKVLDACDTFGRFWIFTSGLTDVGTTLTITDTQTGQVWTRETELGQPYPPVIETEVFECP